MSDKADRPNLVVVCLHEWRWDAAGFMNDPNARTPHMDAVASKGTVFTAATADSLELFDNRLQLLGPVGAAALEAGYDTMAAGWLDARLHQSGYERVATCVPTDPDSVPAHQWTAFGAGRSHASEADHPVTRTGGEAIRLLRTAREPFLLAMPIPGPVIPTDPPAPWDRLLRPDLVAINPNFQLPARTASERYPVDFAQMSEARYRKYAASYYGLLGLIDHQVGRLLGTLSARGFGRTAIVITGAGGHYLGDAGRTAREENPEPEEALMRVPLVMAGVPGYLGPAAVETPTRLSEVGALLSQLVAREEET